MPLASTPEDWRSRGHSTALPQPPGSLHTPGPPEKQRSRGRSTALPPAHRRRSSQKEQKGILGLDASASKSHWWIKFIVIVLFLLCVLLLVGVIAMVMMYSQASKQLTQETEKMKYLSAKHMEVTAQYHEVSENCSSVSRKCSEVSAKCRECPINCSEVSKTENETDLEIEQLKADKQSLSETLSALKDSFCVKLETQSKCQVCPSGWTVFRTQNGNSLSTRCYLFSSDQRSWEHGREKCKELDSDYVVINTDQEKELLKRSVAKTDKYWIGLSDREKEGEWRWVNGTDIKNTKMFWDVAQPDNYKGSTPEGEDCAAVFLSTLSGLLMHDLPCGGAHRYICEMEGRAIYL